jgi:hypothetical protein
MRSALLVTTALVALGLVPATVSAAQDLTGRTSQQKPVLMRTSKGVPVRMQILWVATQCDKKGWIFQTRTYFRFDPGDATATTLNDRGTYKFRQKKERYTVTTILAGQKSGKGWTGTLQTNAIVHSGGKKVDTCKTTVNWSVG